MTTRALSKRIDRLEEVIKAFSKFGSGCVCFPGPAPPFLIYPVLEAIAFKIKCPVHGDRFQLYRLAFIPDWLREREIKYGWPRRSEQYLKAWNASFPRDSWTIQEVVVAGRCWLLPREILETQEIVRLATG